MKKLLLIFYLFAFSALSTVVGQGSESFTNLAITGTSYVNGSFIGDNGITWNYTQATGEQTYPINGKGLLLRRSGENSKVVSGTIAGGISSFSVKMRKAFTSTGDRQIELFINGVSKGQSITFGAASGEDATVQTFSVDNINIAGDFTIELRHITGGTSNRQLVIDDITWSGYSSGPSGTITLTSPVAGTYETNQSFNFTWTSENVSKVKFQVRPTGTTTWETMEIPETDASLGTFAFTVPLSATDGSYDLRIIDAANPAVYSNSVTVTVVDKHFAGLESNSFWPENNAEDVSTDLFANYMLIGFNEPVKFGTGNIYLKKGSDNSTVYTYNATSNNWSYMADWNGGLMLKTTDDLAANTQYYITIDADAIVDLAATPHYFEGFSNNTTWNFTTGSSNSILPIAAVQSPDANGNSTLAGNILPIKTSGIVMYLNGTNGYMIQDGTDAYSGLYVYQNPTTAGIELGDRVNLIGKVTEFNKLTELTQIEYTKVVSKGNALYEPVVLTGALTEANEAMLVKINNVDCKSAFDTYSEFVVTNGSADWTIDNWLYKLSPDPVVGDKYNSITGYVNDYNGLKLAPAKAADVDKIATGVKNINVTSVAARLLNGNLKVIASKHISSITLYSITGSEIMTTMDESDPGDEKGKEITIPIKKVVSDGVYIIVITYADGTTETIKVISE